MFEHIAAGVGALCHRQVEKAVVQRQVDSARRHERRRAIDLDIALLENLRRHGNHIAAAVERVDLSARRDLHRGNTVGRCRHAKAVAVLQERAIGIHSKVIRRQQQAADVELRCAADQNPARRIKPHRPASAAVDRARKPDHPRWIGSDDAVEHGIGAGAAGDKIGGRARRQEIDGAAADAGIGRRPVDRCLR